MAGSRFKYLAPKIKFGYQELVDAITDAIDKAEKLDGATIVDYEEKQIEEKRNFESSQQEAKELWTKLVEANPENAKKILKKMEITFGKPMKLSEITEDQQDLMELVILDMKDMLN